MYTTCTNCEHWQRGERADVCSIMAGNEACKGGRGQPVTCQFWQPCGLEAFKVRKAQLAPKGNWINA